MRWSAAPSNRCPGHRIHAHCCKSRYFERLLLCVSGVILGPESIGFTQMVAEFLHCGSVQVWRPLRGPVHDSPLAMLDAATVAKDDLIPYSLIFPGRKGYNYAAKYNPDHRQAALPCAHRYPPESAFCIILLCCITKHCSQYSAAHCTPVIFLHALACGELCECMQEHTYTV